MKRWIAFAVSGLLFAGTLTAADATPAEKKYADEDYAAAYAVLEASGARDSLARSTEKMTELMVRSNPKLAPVQGELNAFYAKNLGYDALKKDLAEVYLKIFTRDELIELAAFYASPIGRKIAENQATLSSESARVGQQRVQQHLPELQAILMKALQNAQAKQPQVVE